MLFLLRILGAIDPLAVFGKDVGFDDLNMEDMPY